MGRIEIKVASRPMMLPLSRLRFRPILLAVPALAYATLLSWQLRWPCVLAAIIVLGVPHGALDGEIARAVLRPRFGRAWFPIFAVPYLCLLGCVLAAWHVAPLWMLAAFLAASVWHFGSEDAASGDRLEILVRGGLPIALPVLAHPVATIFVFASIAETPINQPPDWLWAAALCWVVLAAAWVGLVAIRGGLRALWAPGLLGCIFLALPPLEAFAIYFVCVHAPAYTAALIDNPHRAPRVRDGRSALLLALPVSGLTLAIGAVLWPLYGGPVPERLLALTIQVLAGLTLPHMLLDAWMNAREAQDVEPG